MRVRLFTVHPQHPVDRLVAGLLVPATKHNVVNDRG